MVKIKEIRKIESPIKEIKKEKKVESLEDEVFDNEDQLESNVVVRRSNKTSTIEASEIPQDSPIRERRISKEDVEEINFRPSYSPGNSNRNNVYTPVGSAESSVNRPQAGHTEFSNPRDLQEARPSMEGGMDNNQDSQRAYAGEEKKDKRKSNL